MYAGKVIAYALQHSKTRVSSLVESEQRETANEMVIFALVFHVIFSSFFELSRRDRSPVSTTWFNPMAKSKQHVYE